jgi:hypothetical protein
MNTNYVHFTGEETFFHSYDYELMQEEMDQPESLNGVEESIRYVHLMTMHTQEDKDDQVYSCTMCPYVLGCRNKEVPASEAKAEYCSRVVIRMEKEDIPVCRENISQQINGDGDEVKTLMVLIAPVVKTGER